MKMRPEVSIDTIGIDPLIHCQLCPAMLCPTENHVHQQGYKCNVAYMRSTYTHVSKRGTSQHARKACKYERDLIVTTVSQTPPPTLHLGSAPLVCVLPYPRVWLLWEAVLGKSLALSWDLLNFLKELSTSFLGSNHFNNYSYCSWTALPNSRLTRWVQKQTAKSE